MVTCRDVWNLRLDGMELVAGEAGLDDHIVSWSYMVQTRPYIDHMNRGNFAMIVVDYVRFDFEEVSRTMEEIVQLGISGLAISVEEDREAIPEHIKARANELRLPLFYVRWEGASFVDICQSIGTLILETNLQNKRTGDFLYNLLFGYEINEKYIEKLSKQFGFDLSKMYRAGIIVVDRTYGVNLEQDEHLYEYYANCLRKEVGEMEDPPMFMEFLNKFVLLFEAREDKAVEHEIERILQELDRSYPFEGKIKSTCILGEKYQDPKDFGKSYQEAKSFIPKKDILPNSRGRKVISARAMGIYKFLFNGENQAEILEYCNEKLQKMEEYDHANGTFLCDTLVEYYMNGFHTTKTAEALFIHRNSLQYRLAKIKELLGIELDDYVEYLDLVNCILVKKWMFS